MTEPDPTKETAPPVCWWHPTRQTVLSCVRCGRPACPDCLREAPVGHQCIDCVHAARQVHRRAARSPVSGQLSARPVVTPVLIALNLLMYVVTTVQARSPVNNEQAPLFGDWVLWPRAIAGADQWWRLVTSGFLHYGPIHIGVNMIALWVLGQDLERLLGKGRFIAVYLVSLLGGAVSVYLFDDSNRATAGASGAIYGLLGGILVVVLRLRLNPMPAIATIVLNLIITVSIPNISLLGHLGGLVVGALITAAIVYAPVNRRLAWQAASMVVLVVALVALVWYRDAQLSGVMCLTDSGELKCTPPG
ncbi:rhomboid family intramembrane serine protease [Amycolatopsis taiwanensis]|uniref:Rhomboid family intramembrane serine protease n=1 Tax=Amycolatopsis taiwanensis TaxID=342230 RepID=A0A9W6R3A3_9PSEU|nr:rhomboid family intramembrane serine protease [Amycolatopsis taiwanensis]GLY67590.1 rhomboid family intramembrane serine protease [Amycolatopsis taiwanensis]